MTKLTLDITTSLDGFVAGPNASLERPLGEGGERLHEWAFSLAPFRERHGLEGGEHNVDADVVQENVDATGAVVMGRRMFSGGEGPWAGDPNADGWWGAAPPFRVPVFVLTSHARAPGDEGRNVVHLRHRRDRGRARAGPGGRRRQGRRARRRCMFDRLGIDPIVELEATRVIASPSVTHVRFRVLR